MILLILFSVFTITGESLPVINKREVEYYSNTVDIEKMVSVFTDIEIIEYDDLSEGKNYYENRLDDVLGEDNYEVLTNKGEENISVQGVSENGTYPLVFPLIEYRNKYYNIVVDSYYITINELLKKGTFESSSNKNYNDDFRVVNSINIER